MDSRSAAHVLASIAALLQARGENKFKVRAYESAATAVLAHDSDDIAVDLASGALAELKGVGPATLGVLRELVEQGRSAYLDKLQAEVPPGLVELMQIPGFGAQKVQAVREKLGVNNVEELEAAAMDGRLAKLPGFGPRTAAKLLKSIAFLRQTGSLALFHEAWEEATHLLATIKRQKGVRHAEIAGSLRRRCDTVHDIDIVAECTDDPAKVAAAIAKSKSVDAILAGEGTASVRLRYVDGTVLDLQCATAEAFAMALWRATGAPAHLELMEQCASLQEMRIDGETLRGSDSTAIEIPSEEALFSALHLSYIAPELREDGDEVVRAAAHDLPTLITFEDIRGVLHCHSDYSDGTLSIKAMADAARKRGWTYLGISDHSQSAFYAGGMKPDDVQRQHDEIDALNETLTGFRVLKGIEADILADGRVDYDAELLDRFDYVIGSVHSRFAMDEAAMTHRVLTAMDDPHLTILGHPTGRLLLSREAYPLDMNAVIEKAAEKGVCLELNCDPDRLDLSWRNCKAAKARGVMIEIGPDAHSAKGLDWMHLGIGLARKAWLSAADVLNTGTADDVMRKSASRRS